MIPAACLRDCCEAWVAAQEEKVETNACEAVCDLKSIEDIRRKSELLF